MVPLLTARAAVPPTTHERQSSGVQATPVHRDLCGDHGSFHGFHGFNWRHKGNKPLAPWAPQATQTPLAPLTPLSLPMQGRHGCNGRSAWRDHALMWRVGTSGRGVQVQSGVRAEFMAGLRVASSHLDEEASGTQKSGPLQRTVLVTPILVQLLRKAHAGHTSVRTQLESNPTPTQARIRSKRAQAWPNRARNWLRRARCLPNRA